MQILQVTVGEPTILSSLRNQNTASLAASRTGIAAVFYPKAGTGPRFYRVSSDGGRTWSEQMDGPPIDGGAVSGALRGGGVLKPRSGTVAMKGKEDWYAMKMIRLSDDLMSWQTETAEVHVPGNITALDHVRTPTPERGRIIQTPDGNLLMPMYGRFEGDVDVVRAFLVRSTDQGHTWKYYATIQYRPENPYPNLPGHYGGACEPSIELLPDGRMLAMLRTQYSHLPGEYYPMSACWSNDLGRTWTTAVPTKPHLMNIAPKLMLLDNGVVACEYGRPGFHVAFSLDHGSTWQDRVSLSDLPCGVITGQFDMVKTGPNRLAAVGNDADGTKVWPISVERLTVSPAAVSLEGRVLDEQGRPIAGARVQRGPNRYAADDWLEDPEEKDRWYHRDPLTVGSPKLAYRSIREEEGHLTVQSDAQGHFCFDAVPLGEHVLTVEAEGYAPRHRHVRIDPQRKREDFHLKAGGKVCNRVLDDVGRPVPGACVVLNRWHTHTDLNGFFHWSVEAPLPEQVQTRVYKRYSRRYEIVEQAIPFPRIKDRPIVVPRKSEPVPASDRNSGDGSG